MKRVLLLAAVVLALGAGTANACETASAKRVYLQAWAAVHHHFDAPAKPAPRLVREHGSQPGNLAWIGASPSGFREVRIGDGLWAMLGGAQGCFRRLQARGLMVHEFAHVYQDDELFQGITPRGMPFRSRPSGWLGEPGDEDSTYDGLPEGLAQAFAIWAMRVDFGVAGWHLPGNTVYGSYAKEMNDLTTQMYIRRGQFAHYGASARSIPY